MADLYLRAFGTPQFSPSVLADKICGLVILSSVLAALHSRATTGEGQWVDVPMAPTRCSPSTWSSISAADLSIPPVGEIGWSRTLVPTARHALIDARHPTEGD
ncbi:CoA transferase [Actinoallomurus sp. NBC_01490]|uniref:CoA transferase n=1 Tax=Actinoallomurus sp. NBC_01490 TaxID=2903557 RepID=UPI003FA491A5